MFSARYGPELLSSGRLDTDYYEPGSIAALRKIETHNPEPLDRRGLVWGFGAYELCNQIEDSTDPRAPVFIKISDLAEPFVDPESCQTVTDETHALLRDAEVAPGDIVVSIAGTIGTCALIPVHRQRGCTANQALAKFRPASDDSYFVVAYFTSSLLKKVVGREAGGAVQKNLYLYNFGKLPLISLDKRAQTYIGDKVRQAERLREYAARLQAEINTLSLPETIRAALAAHGSKFNRLVASELNARLDGKYYGRRAMAVLKASHDAGGVRIRDLKPKVSNGFEYRDFSETGRSYITVTEVSSGRLDITNAPRIPADARVPLKATVNERCTFVVRTGSVGIAVKAHREDCHACISSHLIRLEFEHEVESAAVTAWLNGAAGRCLQEKITYGGVQPQVSQDDLLALPIPRAVLDAADLILSRWELRERCLRASSRLVTAAKTLVEALIERRIAESDLIATQHAIEKGDQTADHELLARLTDAGFDVPNAPRLFPDLSMLHQTIEAAKAPPLPEAK